MAVTICSGVHPAGWEKYGRRFAETFASHVPSSIGLRFYSEEPVDLPHGDCRSLWSIEGAQEFQKRHRCNLVHTGLQPTRHWRPKDLRVLANSGEAAWRWDALRFYKQCIIPEHASRDLPDEDILVWFDADIVFFRDMPVDFAPKLLGGMDLCYLGRNKGAEIGFWAVLLNPRTRAFLKDLSDMYLQDRVFGLQQFHSAYAFDHVKEAHLKKRMSERDLTPGGRDHVWMQLEPLYRWTDHLKGPRRKNLGYSPEHPLRWWERNAKLV